MTEYSLSLLLLALVVRAGPELPQANSSDWVPVVHDLQCCSDINMELALVLDMSQGLEPLIGHFREHSHEFTEALTRLHPNIKLALTSYVDKPLPFLGHGWGDFKSSVFLGDYCYKNHHESPGFQSPADLERVIANIPTAQGGNDLADNQFGALINAAKDSSLGWSSVDVDQTGAPIKKVLALLTNSISHGLNTAGSIKESGGEWPSVPNATRGWDLWWTAQYWNYSYGRELEAQVRGNVPYHSWVWPTASQFAFSQDCFFGSTVLSDYVLLGDKKFTIGEELTATEQERWDVVVQECTPVDFFDYVNVADGDALALNLHNGEFMSEEDCPKYEYPNQDQVVAALAEKNIKPLVINTQSIPGTDLFDATLYYRWAYNCHETLDYLCVREFYADALHAAAPVIKSPDLALNMGKWMDDLLEQVYTMLNDECGYCPSTTTSTTTIVTTVVTSSVTGDIDPTTGTPATTSSVPTDPVCDLSACKTYGSYDEWSREYSKLSMMEAATRVVKGKCTYTTDDNDEYNISVHLHLPG